MPARLRLPAFLAAAARTGFTALVVLTFSSCTVLEDFRARNAKRAEEKQFGAMRAEARETHAAWRAKPGWKSKTYRNDTLLAQAKPDHVSIEVALAEQRGILLVNGAIAMDFPIASGKRSHPTPAGSYTILQKQKDYASNLYGKIVAEDGTVLNADADTRTDSVPEGATFQPAPMPYWMRLTNTGVGFHVGYVPGRPASHGCIRLRRDTATRLFALTKLGTPVVIAERSAAVTGS